MASSLPPSREKTRPMPFLTTSRDSTWGGTAVALPAMVATAGTILFFVFVCAAGLLATASSSSIDFGVFMDDNVRLLRLRLRSGLLGVRDSRRQVSIDRGETKITASRCLRKRPRPCD